MGTAGSEHAEQGQTVCGACGTHCRAADGSCPACGSDLGQRHPLALTELADGRRAVALDGRRRTRRWVGGLLAGGGVVLVGAELLASRTAGAPSSAPTWWLAIASTLAVSGFLVAAFGTVSAPTPGTDGWPMAPGTAPRRRPATPSWAIGTRADPAYQRWYHRPYRPRQSAVDLTDPAETAASDWARPAPAGAVRGVQLAAVGVLAATVAAILDLSLWPAVLGAASVVAGTALLATPPPAR